MKKFKLPIIILLILVVFVGPITYSFIELKGLKDRVEILQVEVEILSEELIYLSDSIEEAKSAIQETPEESTEQDDSYEQKITTVSNKQTTVNNSYDEAARYIAKTVWAEARGCSKTEQAAVVWCILNRVDSDINGIPDDIIGVVTQPYQFAYYSDSPVTDELFELAKDVISRWEREKSGETNVGRILPKEYLWFHGDGTNNHFRNAFEGGTRWDWSLVSPYE